MNKARSITRILLGLMLVVFGINKFLRFLPMPPLSEAANELMAALLKSGYMMVTVAIVQISCGLLLLLNKHQPLALILVFPVLLNAFLFHLFLDFSGIGGAAVAISLNIFLFFMNHDKYKQLLQS